MSTDKTYNGWTNYETWNIALWLGNEEHSYKYWRHKSESAFSMASASGFITRSEIARFDLADRLKREIQDANPLAEDASMWADLMGAALCEVQWDEIAGNWLSDVDGYEED